MLDKISPDKTKAWQDLTKHYNRFKDVHMKDLFQEDPERFDKFSIRFNNILVDFSKNRINDQTLELLIDLASEVNLQDAISKMFSGDSINETENRAVLHTALRNRGNKSVFIIGIWYNNFFNTQRGKKLDILSLPNCMKKKNMIPFPIKILTEKGSDKNKNEFHRF